MAESPTINMSNTSQLIFPDIRYSSLGWLAIGGGREGCGSVVTLTDSEDSSGVGGSGVGKASTGLGKWSQSSAETSISLTGDTSIAGNCTFSFTGDANGHRLLTWRPLLKCWSSLYCGESLIAAFSLFHSWCLVSSTFFSFLSSFTHCCWPCWFESSVILCWSSQPHFSDVLIKSSKQDSWSLESRISTLRSSDICHCSLWFIWRLMSHPN